MQKSKHSGKGDNKTRSGSVKVYLLWFVEEQEESDIELLIGVYATRADAKAAVERVKSQPGFATYPKGFQVCPYEIGKDHWSGGFVKA